MVKKQITNKHTIMINYKSLLYSIYLCLTVAVVGCLKDDTDLPEQNAEDYYQVYMPLAVQNPIAVNLKFGSEAQAFVYGANYGGLNYPGKDIQVDFSVASNLVDSFNLQYGTQYELLPQSAYSLAATSAVIPAGTLATQPLDIKVISEGNMDIFKSYLLPVSLSLKSNDFKINENLKTTFYVVTASLSFDDFQEYDRSNWEVIEVSSEEPAEGPDNGGLAIHTLDGKTSTFWHSAWANSSPGPPHYIAIDMGETKTLHGFSFTGRQSSNAGKPQTITIETSMNGTDWETAQTFTLQNTNSEQKFFLTSGFKEAKYFKMIVTAMFGGANYTHLAELKAF
ncbi:hypothetical protein DC498_18635 [Terrimonas sp.]|nr:hypothetical protein DC498_18635 [Terrimonas sp.]